MQEIVDYPVTHLPIILSYRLDHRSEVLLLTDHEIRDLLKGFFEFFDDSGIISQLFNGIHKFAIA